MTLWFFISIWMKRNDIADIAWGLGFMFIAWLAILWTNNFSLPSLLILLLVNIWGIRLAWHIYLRNKGKAEDYRYLAWRKEWGKLFYLRSYLQVYILQGVLLFLISLSVMLVMQRASEISRPAIIIGLLIWLIGFAFEAIGDYQLKTFLTKTENKGRLIQSGLWKYTRHPNYFGEVLLWWGLGIIAFFATSSWLVLISPLVITFLITRVSGIPMLEKKMKEHPDFAEYSRKTSIFFPWVRRKI